MSRNFPGNKEQKGNRVAETMFWEKDVHLGKNNNNKKQKQLSIFTLLGSETRKCE